MGKLKLLWWIVIGVMAIVIGVWVVVDNPEPVMVRLAGFKLQELPTGLWILLAFTVGCLFGLLCGWPQLLRQKKQLNSLRRQLRKAGL
ncbi:MAG: LapA family protein [Porticoccaceae bacterium]|nr:LapA family protein [Pseudomonadales bacterium]MCP5171957.1 LapA family protein [Pseudomonadales bacterium]